MAYVKKYRPRGRPFKKGNSYKKINPKGQKTGNRKGGGATLRHWWSTLLSEDSCGRPTYTVQAIWQLAEAKHDDPQVSPAKRIAARMIVEAIEGGTRGIAALNLIFDRLEGRPSQSVSVSGSLVADPAAEITEATLRKIREAVSDNGADPEV